MKLYCIQDSSNRYVMSLLEDSFFRITDSNFIENYHPDFSSNPSNIFYILNDKKGRYRKGSYYVLENNGEFICSAGWNEYELNSNVALALTRAYVEPKHRTKYYMGKYILPKIIENTRQYRHLYITADSFNSSIYQWFVRADEGKSPGMFNDWPDIYRKFKPIGKQTIYYIEQYVAEYQE